VATVKAIGHYSGTLHPDKEEKRREEPMHEMISACALILLLGAVAMAAGQVDFNVGNLRCEYRENPLGIDAPEPRISWEMAPGGANGPEIPRGLRQIAYRVLVASSEKVLSADQGDLWDSGRAASDQSVLVEYKGKPLTSGMSCVWKVKTWLAPPGGKGHATPWSKPARWTMGLLTPKDWQAKWISPAEADINIASWLRKGFDLSALPERAIMSVNIAGYVELYVNGKKVGKDVLTPAVSDHARQVFYVTYDVTPFLRKGRNVVGLWLGRGWASRQVKVRAQLEAKLPGQAFVLGTDATWKSKASSYRHIGNWKWNNFGGELYDARDEVPGWCEDGLDDSSWASVVAVKAPAGEVVPQKTPLNRIGKRIPAVAITKLPAAGGAAGDRYEIDFGTALTGWLRLKMPPLKTGSVVKMTFADVVRSGKYQHCNQVSEFVSAGKSGEVFENKFNYAGFRYVVVDGLPSPPAREDAEAMLVESDLETAGSFECSNELFNRIHRLTLWGQRCLDLGGYYVDCPHRERMGYGDGQVAVEGFMTSFRADAFYRKWLWDWRLRQGKDGALPHMAPFGRGGGGPAWPGLLAAITWRHYLYYGDRRVLEENYLAVRRYVDWLEGRCTEGILRKYGGKWDFIGDWVAPRRGMDTHNWPGPAAAELFNNCYRVYQWELLAKTAAALGREDEVSRCQTSLAKIRPLIHNAFYDAAKKQYVVDEQSYYVMPLMTGVTDQAQRPAVLKRLEENILVKNKGHLDTGMLGTYFMMEYLREIGRNDLVFEMFNQTTYPSWGHMLAEGATTCWEQWNGHWSRIHSCFTSADNWLYQGPAGIVADPAGAGFRKVIIKPAIVGDLTWVKAHHDSPYGRIVSNWKLRDGRLTMEIVIPTGATATVYVPAREAGSVREGNTRAADAAGVRLLRSEKDAAVFAVESGSYEFSAPCP